MQDFPTTLNEKQWFEIENIVYYRDGSLRDIYVLETTLEDWNKWIDLVNEKYKVDFFGNTDKPERSINKDVVFDHWKGKSDRWNTVKISIGSVQLNCHFFSEDKIENFIDPEEIKNVGLHNQFIGFLVDVSKTLNKPVIVTPENRPGIIYMKVDGGTLSINLKVDYTLG